MPRLKESDVMVGWFYCDGNYEKQNDVRNILGSLIKQFIGVSPSESVLEPVRKLYKAHERDNEREQDSASAIKRICQEFESILLQVCAHSKVYIFIDALDECEEARRQRLLGIVVNLGKARNINLFLSSRNESDITRALSGFPVIDVDEHQLNAGDIYHHIDWAFGQYDDLKAIQQGVKQEIIRKLKEKSDGM